MVNFKKLEDAIRLLNSGKVGIIPSDTVYGLVARASDEAAVGKLYGLKNREQKPGTLIAANIDQLVELGLKYRYLKAVEHFWPNAISVVIPTGPVLNYLHLGKYSLAVRIPKSESLRKFLEQTGPLVTTSANHPGETPADTIAEAKDYFGDEVDFYVDGGDLSKREPSTVIRMVDDAIEILRPGAVKLSEEGEIL